MLEVTGSYHRPGDRGVGGASSSGRGPYIFLLAPSISRCLYCLHTQSDELCENFHLKTNEKREIY